MSGKKVDINSLNHIFSQMVQTMNRSKNDIFIISEQNRQSLLQMQKELEIVHSKLAAVLIEGDLLVEETRISRKTLGDVSKHFNTFTEEQVREAYEQANDLQIKLSINRTEDRQLHERRDDLERRLNELNDSILHADQLAGQANVVTNYLTSDLKNVGPALETAKLKQDFSLKIIEAQEEERKRLSREIHDGPAQMMANVLVRSDLIERTYRENGIDEALVEITSLKLMVRIALTEVRRIIYDLRPMALDDLGLVPTIRKYLMNIEEYNTGCQINFRSHGEQRRLISNFEIAVFRLVQESVTNATKHGKCQNIWVDVEWTPRMVTVTVKDNGTGFDQRLVRESSFGLIGMQERIDLLKGEMIVKSSLGNGTIMKFKIPLNEE
ncbi:sensor histidine kinase [Paenisporosarcina antarctica]|uniref:Signal transduction histidine-protein kinase/phosphatase DegS n=1 Tax=Paenisporosarcina antarctica TaxID=417367 RepID=A0A4P6ZZ83_9BACL|nr:sensor histidine kinase [Paenisporosarcina antarctica]QBP41757.1 histidine kinase [Paenisporosarcina antarctica]